ncbi:MAG: DUF1707 domain-containing protein [Nitrolancea sp.]
MSEQRPEEIRASDQERERTGEMLREATVEGRLTLDEFSERYTLAQRARTRGELDLIVRDLPSLGAPAGRIPPAKVTAILSGVERTGAWRLGPSTTVTSILGSCKLDLRQSTISSDHTTLDVHVVFGSLELIVPPGVDVDIDAAAILSGREMKLSRPISLSGTKPLIRITGSVFCGSIIVRDTPNLGDRIKESISSMFEAPRPNDQR